MNKHRKHYQAPLEVDALPGKSKKLIILLLALAILVIIIIIFYWKRDKSNTPPGLETNNNTIVIDGVSMTLIPAEKQIAEIEDNHAVIESCTSDQGLIYCTGKNGEKFQYKREYLQDFRY